MSAQFFSIEIEASNLLLYIVLAVVANSNMNISSLPSLLANSLFFSSCPYRVSSLRDIPICSLPPNNNPDASLPWQL
jgi:hypothetical protein